MDADNLEAILDSFHQGSRYSYDMFVSMLHRNNTKSSEPENQISNADLIRYLKSLSKCVTRLNRCCKDLVSGILNIDWINKDDDVLEEFHRFICELVSAQTNNYLLDILEVVVGTFKPKVSDSISPNVKARHCEVFCFLHRVLLSVFKIAPSASLLMIGVLQSRYPHINIASTYTQECYVQNLLKLSGYPVEFVSQKLRRDIFQLIISHLINLDVINSREELWEITESKNWAESVYKEDAKEEKQMAHKHAQTLDNLMVLMLAYIHGKCFTQENVLDMNGAKQLYLDMLSAFNFLLLPTPKSSHVQFLIFYLCSFAKPFADGFIDFLWEKVEKPSTESCLRQTAATYIGSFLARAKYVSTGMVMVCLQRMKEWILRYINVSSDPEAVHHKPFYSVCQALFYLFVFRSRELLSTEKGRTFCKSLNLQKIVLSDLNPLKYCNPNVALYFSTVVRSNHLAVCDSIIAKNKRSFIPEMDSKTSDFLDTFFPFDPCLLPKSAEVICDLYQDYECPTAISTIEHKSFNFAEEQDMDIDSNSCFFLDPLSEMMVA